MSKTTRTILSLAMLALIFLLLGIAYHKDQAAAPELMTEAAVESITETAASTEPAEAAETIPAPTVPPTVPETEAREERFLLTFAGDCTLGANPSNSYAACGFIKTIGEDYGHPFRNVLSYFENDEFTMVNLEGVLADEGNPIPKKHNFRGPTAYVEILTGSSVDAVTLGNNHTFDYGPRGYQSTLDTLDAAQIPYVERDCSTMVTTKNGLKIGLYAMTYHKLDVEDMVAEIAALKEQGADIIVVAPHWGIEGNRKPIPIQEKVGRAAIDAGADIVYGSHPHVLQPIEEYGDGVILYSMGNFSFGGNTSPDDYDTALVQQEVIRDADGQVRLGELTIIPACISSAPRVNNYQPTPYEPGSREYERVLAKLNGTF